jgi:hypothetical protein
MIFVLADTPRWPNFIANVIQDVLLVVFIVAMFRVGRKLR